MARLLVNPGDGAQFAFALDSERATIGRTPENDLHFEDGLVSRQHAEIVLRDGQFSFRDLESRNGSRVNGEPCRERLLHHGDEIRVGRIRIRFEDPVSALAQPTEEHRLDVGRSLRETWHGTRVDAEAVTEPDAALRQALDRLELLDRVGRRVLSVATLDEVLGVALRLLLEEIHAERGVLELWDPASGGERRRLQLGRDGETDQEIRIPRSILDEVVSSRIALVTSDARRDGRFRAGASVVAAEIRSALCAPLWEEDEVHGVLYLDSRETSYRFTRDDLVLATSIANLLAARVKHERLREDLAEQRLVRANLERYHSPEVVKAILSRPDGPGGVEECEVSVLFADIVGFTALAEARAPSEVARLLDAYYELATGVVFAHGGTVNEYVGDSLMAIFGAPLPQPDHADRAVAAGLELLKQVRAHRAAALDEGLRLHLAVNSGCVVVGSVGPPQRMKYAVVGDTVNVAARIERMDEPDSLLVGEATHAALRGAYRCESLGRRRFKGRTREVEVFRVTTS